MWRSVIGFLIGILLIFAAIKLAQKLIANKEKPKVVVENTINKVYTQTVINSVVPVIITEKGNLQALRKVEFYSEVQGVLKEGNKLFKPGQSYAKGSTVFSIDDSEFAASLIAQKSVLYNLIAQVMPDLKLDYPEVFEKWQSYLKDFDLKDETPELPEFSNEKEKFFII